MNTKWFTRKPGDFASHGSDDPRELIVGNPVPDWVELPKEIGSIKVKVLEAFVGPCPACQSGSVRHLRLEQGFHVAECLIHNFLWYKKKE